MSSFTIVFPGLQLDQWWRTRPNALRVLLYLKVGFSNILSSSVFNSITLCPILHIHTPLYNILCCPIPIPTCGIPWSRPVSIRQVSYGFVNARVLSLLFVWFLWECLILSLYHILLHIVKYFYTVERSDRSLVRARGLLYYKCESRGLECSIGNL